VDGDASGTGTGTGSEGTLIGSGASGSLEEERKGDGGKYTPEEVGGLMKGVDGLSIAEKETADEYRVGEEWLSKVEDESFSGVEKGEKVKRKPDLEIDVTRSKVVDAWR